MLLKKNKNKNWTFIPIPESPVEDDRASDKFQDSSNPDVEIGEKIEEEKTNNLEASFSSTWIWKNISQAMITLLMCKKRTACDSIFTW